MTCRKINRKLLDFIDNNLPESEINEINAHLAECEECYRLLQKLQKTWIDAKEEKIPYQPFFYTRLKARMEKRHNRTAGVQKLQKFILQPAMYFAILGFGIFIGVQIGKGPTYEEQSATAYINEMESFEIYDNNQSSLIQVDSLEQAILEIQNSNRDE
ncbi:MAG: anti-sigma factor family protein [Bacteroidales bacterium]